MADNSWITNTGESLLANALISATPINIDSWKIGSTANVAIDQTLTDIVGTELDSGTVSELSFDLTNPDQVNIKLILQESKGPYDIGNVGLFNGSNLVAFATFETVREKIPNAVGVVGNRLVINIPIQFVDVQSAINFSILSVSTASWPYVDTIANLPDPNISSFEGYIVREDPSQNRPITAIRNEEPAGSGTFVWTFDYHNKIAGDSQANTDCIEIDTTTGHQSFRVNSTELLQITDSQLRLSLDGSNTVPSIGWLTDADTGLYLKNTGSLAATAAGLERLTVNGPVSSLGYVTVTETALSGASADALANTLVLQNSTDCGMTIFSDESEFGIIYFGNQTNNTEGGILYNHSANLLFLRSGDNNILGLNSNSQIITFNDGTAALPSYSFSSDLNLGIFKSGSDVLGISAGGNEIATFGNAGIRNWINGSTNFPSYSFNSGTTSGMWYDTGAGDIVFSRGTVERLRIGQNGIELPTGLFNALSLAFVGDEDTGIYNYNTNALGIVCGGGDILSFNTDRIEAYQDFRVADGDVSPNNPSIGFIADPDTGFYRPGSDILGFIVGGAEGLRLTTSSLELASGIDLLAQNGTAGNPSISFSGNSLTGLYYKAPGVCVTVNAIERMEIGTNVVIRPNVVDFSSEATTNQLNNGVRLGSSSETVISKSDNISQMYAGTVNAGGVGGNLPTGWSSANNGGTGLYRVTHNLGTTQYSVVATSQGGVQPTTLDITDVSSNSFDIRIVDASSDLPESQIAHFQLMVL